MRTRLLSALLLPLAALLLPVAAAAAPSDLVTSGRLLDANGGAIDGSRAVTWRLVDALGAEAWSLAQTVDFDHGYYAARLTGLDPADFTEELTLVMEIAGVEVGRQALAAVPHALSVDGAVRVSAAPAACDGGSTGTLRYNAGTLEVCDGTAYAPLVTGAPSGSVVDYVYAQTTTALNLTGTIPWDDTAPTASEGGQVLNLSITPKAAGNLLVFEGLVNWVEPSNHSNYFTVSLVRDGDSAAIATAVDAASNGNGRCTANGYTQVCSLPFRFTTTAPSTSPQLYRLRAGLDGGNVYINQAHDGRKLGGSLVSSLSVTEIVP